MRRGLRLETAQRLQHLVAIGLQRVRPEVDRGAPRERRPLLGRAGPEGAVEFAREPLRIIAPDISRRIGRELAAQAGKLGLR